MAYREVRRMDIDQIIRRWLAGEKIRAIARSTSEDRNTVRRIVRIANKEEIGRETLWLDEGKLQAIRQMHGPAGSVLTKSTPGSRSFARSILRSSIRSSRVRRLLLSFNSTDTSRL